MYNWGSSLVVQSAEIVEENYFELIRFPMNIHTENIHPTSRDLYMAVHDMTNIVGHVGAIMTLHPQIPEGETAEQCKLIRSSLSEVLETYNQAKAAITEYAEVLPSFEHSSMSEAVYRRFFFDGVADLLLKLEEQINAIIDQPWEICFIEKDEQRGLHKIMASIREKIRDVFLDQVEELQKFFLEDTTIEDEKHEITMSALYSILKGEKRIYSLSSPDKQITVSNDVTSDVTFNFSPVYLVRAVDNIIKNAVLYAGDYARIHISLEERENAIVISVADNGRGLSSKKVQEVQLFGFRGSDGSDAPQGSGIGLYSVHMCIAEIGGNFEFESTEGVGTTARIVLPFAGQVGI